MPEPAERSRQPLIEVRDLRFTYHRAAEPAVRGLDFDVERGEIFGFLGPNGAGKSTTQKILIGLLREFAGRVTVLGSPLPEWGADFYEHIGVAFEFPNHYLKLTGLENLAYFRALYSQGTLEPADLLQQVDLAGDGATLVSQYSKGMKTRLSVARALLNDPELLFLDEPTTGLDPVSARRIKQLIREQRDGGKTVFLTTHDMAVADELCDRVAFIVDGGITLIDTPRNLKLEYGDPRVRVEVVEGGHTERREFPLVGLGENADFLEAVRHPGLQTIHTLEASLEDIFVQVTGRALA
ncbi:MAG: ABC transporter ATP-binding protein [Gemmatimonadota bacterium]